MFWVTEDKVIPNLTVWEHILQFDSQFYNLIVSLNSLMF